ncbi:MAG TPA: alpha/beta hydrolase [Galbitalea sp.]|jgi:pimeloyl-ACP methyl ester carboxylesterase
MSGDERPNWYRGALGHEPELGTVDSDGVAIAYRAWGTSRAGTSDLLLVHGGAAHARWWDHLAPLLAADRRVVAMDLAGHGDSGHRQNYSMDAWADDLTAVLAGAGLGERPVLAGHSLGGMVSTILAARGTPGLAGLIVVDSPIEPEGPGSRAEADSPSFGNARVYPTRDEAIARFRPVPPQAMIPYIAHDVASASLREVDGGWSWKFDPSFVTMTGRLPRTLDGLPCRVVLLAGQRGILSDAARRAADESSEVAVVEIADAGHAMMLDQPLALLAALRGVLAGWATSDR